MFRINGNGIRNPIKRFEVFVFRSLPDSCFWRNWIEREFDDHMTSQRRIIVSFTFNSDCPLEGTLGVSHALFLTKEDLEPTRRI